MMPASFVPGRHGRLAPTLLLVASFGSLLTRQAPAMAQEAGGQEKAPAATPKDDFTTGWFGARVGWWYQPELDIRLKTSNVPASGGAGGVPSSFTDTFDGTLHRPSPDDFLHSSNDGTPEGELFVDLERASVSLWGVAPFRYIAPVTFSRLLIDPAGGSPFFNGALPGGVQIDQFLVGLDIKAHILNDRFIRLSPVLGLRLLGTNLEKLAWKMGHWNILPYPEVGLEVRAGYRSIFEVDAKATAFHIAWGGVGGTTALIEAGLTVYPLALVDVENVGIRLGGRWYYLDVMSWTSNRTEEFSVNARMLGANLSVIARF